MGCPVRPPLGECSGRGVCVAGACICDAHFTNAADWVPFSNDCGNHIPTIAALWSLNLLVDTGGLLYAGYKLWGYWQRHRSWRVFYVQHSLLVLLSCLASWVSIVIKFALSHNIGTHWDVTILQSICVDCINWSLLLVSHRIGHVLLRLLHLSGHTKEQAERVVRLLNRALKVSAVTSTFFFVPAFFEVATGVQYQYEVNLACIFVIIGHMLSAAGPPSLAALRLASILRSPSPDAGSAELRESIAKRLDSTLKRLAFLVVNLVGAAIVALAWPWVFWKSNYMYVFSVFLAKSLAVSMLLLFRDRPQVGPDQQRIGGAGAAAGAAGVENRTATMSPPPAAKGARRPDGEPLRPLPAPDPASAAAATADTGSPV